MIRAYFKRVSTLDAVTCHHTFSRVNVNVFRYHHHQFRANSIVVMDDLACDPDIGPDLVILLTQKVKTTREALNASLKACFSRSRISRYRRSDDTIVIL